MEALMAAPWRLVPAAALMVLGMWVAAAGVRRQAGDLRRPVTDPAKALGLARALRVLVLGLALTAIGAGWLWRVPALVVLALVIACEEMWEISVVVEALGAAPGIRASGRGSRVSGAGARRRPPARTP
jgi:hypothetical protein